MKKLGGIILSACIAATLVAGPAQAGRARTVEDLTKAEAVELCTQFFAEDACRELAGPWHKALVSQSPAAMERFADLLLAETGVTRAGLRADGPPLCEIVFSEEVCDTITAPVGMAVELVLGIVENPGAFIAAVRNLVLYVADTAVNIIVCTLNPSCAGVAAPRAFAGDPGDPPCRDIFSDAVCDAVEDPGKFLADLILRVYNVVRCYLDPACSDIIVFCTHITCPAAKP